LRHRPFFRITLGCLWGWLLLAGRDALKAQTLGGEAVFTFLREANGPELNALGGVNLTNDENDLSLAFMQPSLLRDSMHLQMVANFNSLYAGVDDYNWMLAYHHPGLNMNFALGATYVDYGTITQTDPSGNILGDFRPHDYVVQGTVAGKYLERWYYGFTFKYIGSDLGIYRSNGIAADVGLNYQIADKGWQIGLAAVNMGAQLKTYNGANKEELPFDLQVGISKRLLKAPLQFSLTFDHLHEWNLGYSDSAFNASTGANPKEGFGQHLLQHMIFAAQLYASRYIEVTLGYNYLLRQELSLNGEPNGLTGVSFGVGVLLPSFSFRYTRTGYQSNTGNNQIGVNLPLDKYFARGRK
jgi:hypothetical protein